MIFVEPKAPTWLPQPPLPRQWPGPVGYGVVGALVRVAAVVDASLTRACLHTVFEAGFPLI